MPPSGAGVWMEFEQGDPSFPIWTGCWYGSATEVPEARRRGRDRPQKRGRLQTGLQCTDRDVRRPAETGLTLKAPGGASIVVNDSGIHIDNGNGATVSLSGIHGDHQRRRPFSGRR